MHDRSPTNRIWLVAFLPFVGLVLFLLVCEYLYRGQFGPVVLLLSGLAIGGMIGAHSIIWYGRFAVAWYRVRASRRPSFDCRDRLLWFAASVLCVPPILCAVGRIDPGRSGRLAWALVGAAIWPHFVTRMAAWAADLSKTGTGNGSVSSQLTGRHRDKEM